MKLFSTFILLLTLFSCGDREQKLREKESELNQKEQELLEREKALEGKDLGDHTDSILTGQVNAAANDSISGLWSVTMTCIETDCEGSAVGDIKTERWDISYKNGTLQAEAQVNDKLKRVYRGAQNGEAFLLSVRPTINSNDTKAKMLVRLKPLSYQEMEGRREIYREGCRIIYSLELEKQ
ncbi:hypothetical protein [Desertivirga arenae]|uniref:hypothetical protein n=1 Tax=Desertivirga arenae TaxID=2810309 RepID=UPI001A96B618|nr:hypothetical protein [Pedobacter sp. SYSU D00823]